MKPGVLYVLAILGFSLAILSAEPSVPAVPTTQTPSPKRSLDWSQLPLSERDAIYHGYSAVFMEGFHIGGRDIRFPPRSPGDGGSGPGGVIMLDGNIGVWPTAPHEKLKIINSGNKLWLRNKESGWPVPFDTASETLDVTDGVMTLRDKTSKTVTIYPDVWK